MPGHRTRVESRRLTRQLEQRQDAVACAGLDRSDVHLAAYSLDLLFDANGSGFDVDILPTQAEDFTTA